MISRVGVKPLSDQLWLIVVVNDFSREKLASVWRLLRKGFGEISARKLVLWRTSLGPLPRYSLINGQSPQLVWIHYDDVIMGAMASQIPSLTIVYSTVYSGADQIEHQSSASLAFVWGIHRGPVNSPHKWPVTRKMFPFDDVIVYIGIGRWITAPTF